MSRQATPCTRENPVGLTQRQIEALIHIVSGATDGTIAGKMGISISTAQKYREALNRKMGVHCPIDLARAAIYHDYVDLITFLEPLRGMTVGNTKY